MHVILLKLSGLLHISLTKAKLRRDVFQSGRISATILVFRMRKLKLRTKWKVGKCKQAAWWLAEDCDVSCLRL
jgi:hypothetical protein